MSLLTTSQRDELRAALLGELVAARTVAFSAEVLARRVIRTKLLDFEFTLADAEAQIEALHSRGLAQRITGTVATTPHFQATSAGVAALAGGV